MVGERIDRLPTGHLLLGLLEIVLVAATLLVAPMRQGLIGAAAMAWAFTAGSILTFDAVRASRRWSTMRAAGPQAGTSAPHEADRD